MSEASGGDDDDQAQHQVVVNDEEQYSLWPAGRPIPRGWRAVGESRSKAECLAYITQVWTDMRPLSLRRAMSSKPSESKLRTSE